MPLKTVSLNRDGDERPGGSFRERDGQESQHSYTNDHHKYLWVGAGDWAGNGLCHSLATEEVDKWDYQF
jgi:hypothetical protein